MKKIKVEFSYISGYYPTKRSRIVRYREERDSILVNVPLVEEKEFPVVMKSIGSYISSTFSRMSGGNILRGYQGRLMGKIKPHKVFYCSSIFSVCDDGQHPYTEKSVDVPDDEIQGDKIHTRTKMLERIAKAYENVVYFEGEFWDVSPEPYVEGKDRYISLQYPNSKIHPNLGQFRIDDWINTYACRYRYCENPSQLLPLFKLSDGYEIELSDGYEKYLNLQYDTMSPFDSRYHLDMENLPNIVYEYGSKNSDYIVYFVPDYGYDLHAYYVNGVSENEALAEFFKANDRIPYKNIDQVVKRPDALLHSNKKEEGENYER